MSKQVLRSGTGIGANRAKAKAAISSKDFTLKIYIALKECYETLYWLEILKDTDYLTESMYVSLKEDCEELRRMLSATTKTMTD